MARRLSIAQVARVSNVDNGMSLRSRQHRVLRKHFSSQHYRKTLSHAKSRV